MPVLGAQIAKKPEDFTTVTSLVAFFRSGEKVFISSSIAQDNEY
jgi:hypothetical protein